LGGGCRLEEFEGSGNITWHGEVQEPVVVVPGESNPASAVEFARPVDGSFVVGDEGREKVVDVGFAGVGDTEIIDDEGEEDGAAGVWWYV
jgi:hypothetical protein